LQPRGCPLSCRFVSRPGSSSFPSCRVVSVRSCVWCRFVSLVSVRVGSDFVSRGCTLAGTLRICVRTRKSAILGLWAAPAARETLPKGAGRRPVPLGRVSRAPEAAQTLKMSDLRVLKQIPDFFSQPQYGHVHVAPSVLGSGPPSVGPIPDTCSTEGLPTCANRHERRRNKIPTETNELETKNLALYRAILKFVFLGPPSPGGSGGGSGRTLSKGIVCFLPVPGGRGQKHVLSFILTC